MGMQNNNVMKNHVERNNLKAGNIFARCIISLLCVALTVLGSIFAIKEQKDIEDRVRCYNNTDFEVIIKSPSKAQVEELRTNNLIDNIVPFHDFYISVTCGSVSKTIDVLSTNDVNNYRYGLLTDDMVTSGTIDLTKGVVLDKKAANLLGASVGGTISYTIKGKTYTEKVVAITTTSYLGTFSNGVILSLWSQQKATDYGEKNYDIAFVDSSNPEQLQNNLSDYIPLGTMQTYVEYKAARPKPSYYTDSDWEQSLQSSYAIYCQNYKNGNFENSVVLKTYYEQDIMGVISKMESKVSTLKTVFIVLPIAICLIGYALVLIMEKKKIVDDVKKGLNPSKVIKANCIFAFVVTLICGAVGVGLSLLVAYTPYNFASFTTIALQISLPALVSCLVLPLENYLILHSLKN